MMQTVSTGRFFTLTRMAGFVRTTRNTGRIGEVEYFVMVAPEDAAPVPAPAPWWKRWLP